MKEKDVMNVIFAADIMAATLQHFLDTFTNILTDEQRVVIENTIIDLTEPYINEAEGECTLRYQLHSMLDASGKTH